MKRILPALLILTLVLGACASSPAAPQTESAQPSAVASVDTAPANTAEISQPTAAASERNAIIAETEGEVLVQAAPEDEFEAASNGFVIYQGGGLQTGADGRVRLDLMPEKTIVRIAPNSAFVLSEASQNENGEPKTSLALFFGKVFILLNGGSLDVETPSGVASVRGSVLSVTYNPATGRIQAACVEGQCTIENEEGEEVPIPEGESGHVDENGEIYQYDGIDQDEIVDWLEEVPEIDEFLNEEPDPNDYYDFDWYDEYEFDPNTYFDSGNSGEDEGFWFFDEYQDWDWSDPDYWTDENSTEEMPTDESTGEYPTEEATDDSTGGDPATEDPTGGDPATEEPTPDP